MKTPEGFVRGPVRNYLKGLKAYRFAPVQMGLGAARDLQGGGVHLDEVLAGEPAPERGADTVAGHQPRSAVGVDVGAPPGGGGMARQGLVPMGWRGAARRRLAIGARIV